MEGLRTVRVGVYGTGNFANRTHIPNLLRLPGVEIVALADANPEALAATAARLPGARAYPDAHAMLAAEKLDVLYSCVPAFARTDVEQTAVAQGIHLFSEKPQALRMAVARAIDEAVRGAGVLSTVGFRERYRPLFQEARRLLADKALVHITFHMTQHLPHPPTPGHPSWYQDLERSGGAALDWGVHAMDLARFIGGQNIAKAQAFYNGRTRHGLPLSYSLHYQLTNGATMTLTFALALGEGVRGEPFRFTFYYEGGYLMTEGYETLKHNGELVYTGQDYDPWFEHDRLFIEAVRTGDSSRLLNDYHDGLYTLAPILAAWESAKRGGEMVDVEAFMRA